MAENLPPSTSQQLKSETESAPASLSRTTSIKGILKTRSESQLILKVPIKGPERQSIITKFENGAASDNESLASVRFALETEVGDEPPNPKRKRKNTGKPKPQVSSFVNPAFETDESSQSVKLAELVEQLIDHPESEQGDCHPFGRGNVYERAFHGKGSDAFLDSGKMIIWFVLALMMLGMAGGIIFLSERRSTDFVIPVNATTTLIS